MNTLAYLTGSALICLTLFDVYRTVLANGMGRGPIESNLSRLIWFFLREVGKLTRSAKATATMCGPILVASLLVVWSGALILGFALIYWPQLSSGIASSNQVSVDSFNFALYYSGYSLTTLGLGDLYPRSDLVRILTVVESWIGFTMLTLSISYVLSVYQAILKQQSLSLHLHSLSAGTGEPSVLTEQILRSASVEAVLHDIHTGFIQIQSSHHQYPVIHYFQREEEKYATTRLFYLALDSLSRILSLKQKCKATQEAEACWMTLNSSLQEFATMIVGSENARLEKLLLTTESEGLDESVDIDVYHNKRNEWLPYLYRISRYLNQQDPTK